jgi:hypothetical protein
MFIGELSFLGWEGWWKKAAGVFPVRVGSTGGGGFYSIKQIPKMFALFRG